MIRTVLFDLDGTILNTNDLILRSFQYVWERKGLGSIAKETLASYAGEKLQDVFRKLGGAETDDEAEEMMKLYREYHWAHHDELVQAFPHAGEVLAALRWAGVRVGAVTTKIRQTAVRGLEHCGLLEYMEVIVTQDDVVHVKPHPEPVVKALDLLGAERQSALMVGDSRSDLLAARAAGVRSAAVSWSMKSKKALQECGPDYWLDDFRDLLDIAGLARGGGK